MDIGDQTLSRLESEFRRGALALAVLSGLREPQYGYSLRQTLSAAGLPVEEGRRPRPGGIDRNLVAPGQGVETLLDRR